MALAGTVSYVIADFLKAYLPAPAYWLVLFGLFFALYKLSNHYLKSLKD